MELMKLRLTLQKNVNMRIKTKFPMEILPEQVQLYFNDLIKYNKFNPEYLCGSFMTLASIYIGNKYKIRYNENFCTNVSTWLAVVGSSSSKKTPAMNKVLEPLINLERRRYRKYKDELAIYDPESGNIKPTEKQSVVDDFTMESLIKTFSYNPHGLIIKRDELDGLISDNSRYNSGGNEQKFLSMFSGEPTKINRKKDDESYMTENGLLCMIGGVQTEILPKLFSQDRDKNGFIPRMLFVVNDSISDQPPMRGADSSLKDQYINFCESLEYIPEPEYNNAPEIDLTWEAYDYLYEWFKLTLYGKYLKGTKVQLAKSYFMKMEAYTLKFALIMETLCREDKSKCLNEISLESVKKATIISEYFINSFLNILEKVKGEEQDETNTETLVNYLHTVSNKSVHLKSLSILFRRVGLSYGEISKLLKIPKSSVHGYNEGVRSGNTS
jgi:uncharacterized protein DUF3987